MQNLPLKKVEKREFPVSNCWMMFIQLYEVVKDRMQYCTTQENHYYDDIVKP